VASAPGERRRFSPARVVTAASTLVGLVSGIIALVFVFAPQLEPDPPEPKPTRTAVRLAPLTFEPRISRRQFLERTDTDRLGFTETQLAQPGAFVRFRVAIKGFKNIPLTLKRELIDVESGDEVSDISPVTITPPEADLERDWQDWIPLPPRTGTYYVVIKLLAKGEVAPLATLQTKTFRGTS
jgi:hypothetical protein